MKEHEIALSIIANDRVLSHLLEVFGTPENIVNASYDELTERAEVAPAIAHKICGDINSALENAKRECDFMLKTGIKSYCRHSKEYPFRLKQCEDAPFIFYTRGNIDFNSGKWLTIVGTRHASEYGRRMCETLISDLAKRHPDLTIVSGLAYGIDIVANSAAMKYGLKTVAVFGHGLETVYPADHASVATEIVEKGGALISEQRHNTRTFPTHFLARNRIIAGLSEGTLVVESAVKGGSLATARMASDYNREVMAVPGRITDTMSQGTNFLIKSNRASLIDSASDIESLLGWQAATASIDMSLPENKESEATNEDPFRKRIIDYMRNRDSASINELVENLGIRYSDIHAIIIDMEFDNLIKLMPGNIVIKY